MGKMKTVAEIAKLYKITGMGVRLWIKKGLPYKIEKVIGIKPRMIIDLKDVEEFIKIGIRNK